MKNNINTTLHNQTIEKIGGESIDEIVRMFLEKYEILDIKSKDAISAYINFMSSPRFIVTNSDEKLI